MAAITFHVEVFSDVVEQTTVRTEFVIVVVIRPATASSQIAFLLEHDIHT